MGFSGSAPQTKSKMNPELLKGFDKQIFKRELRERFKGDHELEKLGLQLEKAILNKIQKGSSFSDAIECSIAENKFLQRLGQKFKNEVSNVVYLVACEAFGMLPKVGVGTNRHSKDKYNQIFYCEENCCEFDEKPYVRENKDNIKCPVCGANIVNEKLNHAWGQSGQKIRRGASGTPELYKDALDGFNIFLRLYKAEKATLWKYEIGSLDVILDIAPKIFDIQQLNKILITIRPMNLQKYPHKMINTICSVIKPLKSFYNNIPANTQVRQVDLVKQLTPMLPKDIHPSYTDASWYIYVWRQFGMVKVEKKGRYNFITRNQKNI